MKKNLESIERKLRMAEEDLERVRAKRALEGEGFLTVGGSVFAGHASFQAARVELLRWMVTAPTQAIADRLRDHSQKMGAAVRLKYGDMRGLPESVVLDIALVELLELGLGLHPCQQPNAPIAGVSRG